MILEKPFAGFGYGNFEKNYREFYIQGLDNGSIVKPPQNVLIHPHNEILLWVVEGGVIPLIGIILFIFSYLLLFNAKIIIG